MKKIALSLVVLMSLSMITFSQVKQGDVELFQKYFGTEKMVLVKEYMKLTPAQDSVFWNDYNAYETERQELGKRKILLIDKYFKALEGLTEANAVEMVNEVNAIDIEFKALQKKYFKKMTKTIGSVKAAQFYQFESYLNNVINLMIQENIPFVGELELNLNKK